MAQPIQPEQITVEPETGEKPVIKVEPPQQEYEKKRLKELFFRFF